MDRLPGGGLFDLFREQPEHETRYRFGRHLEKFAGLLREAGHDPVILRGGMGAKSRAAALADKAGKWEAWYRQAIPLAEQRYEDYLKQEDIR